MNLFLNSSLQNHVWLQQNSTIKNLCMLFFGVLVLAFASQLSIPLQPVPLTFQSVTVLLIGMMFGAKEGSKMVAAYLFAGAVGLPVFADFSGGLHYFWGATGGYLVGFLPAAFVSGYLAQSGFAKNYFWSFIAALAGVSIIFACGVFHLASLIGFSNAILFGLKPFILTESIKLLILAGIIPFCWKKI